eukprot:m.17779 g.17779  ORF g.17779 m.17779 type:complete len:50 (+) comp7565_c0_seq1:26-175(+)
MCVNKLHVFNHERISWQTMRTQQGKQQSLPTILRRFFYHMLEQHETLLG